MNNIEQAIGFSLKLLKNEMKQCKKSEKYSNRFSFYWSTNDQKIFRSLYADYGIELSLEQRWLIYLSVLNEIGREVDLSLDCYFWGEVWGIYEIAEREIKKEHTFIEPYFSQLFAYALENYKTIWPNKLFVNEVRELLNEWSKSVEVGDRITYQKTLKSLIELKPKSFYLNIAYRDF